jgi:SAM-dependent methyltransferase
VPGPHSDLNRASWDAWAAVHGQDGYYDSAALVAGQDSLTDLEWDGVRAAVGTVAGLDVLHVQCHLAFDAVTLARHGARVTGVDFSPAALAKAHDLAARCGVALDLVEADAADLPASLRDRFDLGYATIGILCWIEDVGAWMRSVAGVLRPGGRLLLIDGHPLGRMVHQADPLVLGFPYANDGPHVFESTGSYAAATPAATTNVLYAHSLGEVVSAAADAGLRVVRLEEHLDSPLGEEGGGVREPDGRHRLRVDGYCLPVLYTLIAERPAERPA